MCKRKADTGEGKLKGGGHCCWTGQHQHIYIYIPIRTNIHLYLSTHPHTAHTEFPSILCKYPFPAAASPPTTTIPFPFEYVCGELRREIRSWGVVGDGKWTFRRMADGGQWSTGILIKFMLLGRDVCIYLGYQLRLMFLVFSTNIGL